MYADVHTRVLRHSGDLLTLLTLSNDVVTTRMTASRHIPSKGLGNNYPLRGGKGTDFEGGVATAAFVTGGALPSHLYGQASNSPIHLVDLHFTICLLAGVNENDCRDDHTPGARSVTKHCPPRPQLKGWFALQTCIDAGILISSDFLIISRLFFIIIIIILFALCSKVSRPWTG